MGETLPKGIAVMKRKQPKQYADYDCGSEIIVVTDKRPSDGASDNQHDSEHEPATKADRLLLRVGRLHDAA